MSATFSARVRIRLFAAAAQAVVAEVQRDAVHPGFELGRARLPARRLAPDAQEHLLRHVLRFERIAQHAPREADHARQMPAHERFRGAGIARARVPDEFGVRIDHYVPALAAINRSLLVLRAPDARLRSAAEIVPLRSVSSRSNMR